MNIVVIIPKFSGFKYVSYSLVLIEQDKNDHIYKLVAKKNGKADTTVARAMQNAINRAWNTTPPEILQKYYKATIKSDRGVPTITEFIYYYSHKIQTA